MKHILIRNFFSLDCNKNARPVQASLQPRQVCPQVGQVQGAHHRAGLEPAGLGGPLGRGLRSPGQGDDRGRGETDDQGPVPEYGEAGCCPVKNKIGIK